MTIRILIADDSEIARARLSELLQCRDHWQVCGQAENGQQALSKAVELKPDIVILDLAMPVMDGLSAAREIGKALPSVPIVLFTLHKIAVVELEAKKAGVRQVVAKPDTDTLFRVVEELMKKRPPEPAQEMTELLASASGPLDGTSAVKVPPQPNESQTSDHNETDTSTPI